jgi:type IV pilus biogenesis protein CpaD/CtpE
MVNHVWLIRLRSFLLLALTLVLASCGSSSRQTTPTESGQQDSERIIVVDNKDPLAELVV